MRFDEPGADGPDPNPTPTAIVPPSNESVADSAVDFEDRSDSSSEGRLDNIRGPPYVRCLIVLVAFLHTKHHTSFRASALILLALNFILDTLPGNLLDVERSTRVTSHLSHLRALAREIAP
ncbi:hypothetical protein C8R45DRAFT_1109631 [Mycena sanguinolenta]|nr:hypothetical protein C8R45DRAFT_1109631 [Mycena sanguinolenta]